MDGFDEKRLPQGLRETLGGCAPGFRGVVVAVTAGMSGTRHADLERRLLEMGFVEGARIELLHEGWLGRDPIAVRVDDATVALRRHDADCILVAGKAASA